MFIKKTQMLRVKLGGALIHSQKQAWVFELTFGDKYMFSVSTKLCALNFYVTETSYYLIKLSKQFSKVSNMILPLQMSTKTRISCE